MEAIAYSTARATWLQTMEQVCDDHAPVIITRKNNKSVVLMSLEDYQALEETAYLLRSPRNAKRLLWMPLLNWKVVVGLNGHCWNEDRLLL
ncbi:MAG: type II toxin-antitoxin system prevent-host-death family antitoxin [Caldilineaceae bacterium]